MNMHGISEPNEPEKQKTNIKGVCIETKVEKSADGLLMYVWGRLGNAHVKDICLEVSDEEESRGFQS